MENANQMRRTVGRISRLIERLQLRERGHRGREARMASVEVVGSVSRLSAIVCAMPMCVCVVPTSFWFGSSFLYALMHSLTLLAAFFPLF